MDIPALAGQQADYTAGALSAFKQGSRHNDVYGKMRLIARLLTDQEIKELGIYYQNMKR
jgi:cytochrome c553